MAESKLNMLSVSVDTFSINIFEIFPHYINGKHNPSGNAFPFKMYLSLQISCIDTSFLGDSVAAGYLGFSCILKKHIRD